jgi:small subunit ribosomal protein S6
MGVQAPRAARLAPFARGRAPVAGPEGVDRVPAVQGLYDLMLMLDPEATDERRSEILQEVQGMIESGGSLVGVHDWGTRRMSFEIDHRAEAGYHLFQFEADAALLDRLNHSLKIADGVLRFRVIGLKPGSPPPPAPRTDAPRPRDEVEEGARAPRAAADARRS